MKLVIRLQTTAFLLLLAFFNGIHAFPPLPGWSHSGLLAIRTIPGWAPLPESAVITDFPLLVRLDKAYFDFSQASADGRDIRFYRTHTKPLPHEIEQWDATSGKAAVWVKIDTIRGNAVQTFIMQWGNPSATGIGSSSSVFDTAAGFSGVWHLGETAGNIARNGTVHELLGIKKNAAEPSPVKGQIGIGQLFDGVDDYIDMGHVGGRNFINGTPSATVSAWVKINAFAPHNQGLLQLSTWSGGEINSYSRANLEISGGSDEFIIYGRAPDDGGAQLLSSDHSPVLGAWYHFAGVIKYSLDSMYLYLNGELDTAAHTPFDQATVDMTNTRSAAIGAGDNATYNYFSGVLDEVRVSRTARSPDWMRLSYLNQLPMPGLVSFPVTLGCQDQFGVGDTVLNISEGSAVSVTGIAKCALLARWYAVHGGAATPLNTMGVDLELGGMRVNRDTTLQFRFSALYVSGAPPDTAWRSRDVTVHMANNVTGTREKPNGTSAPDLFFSIPGRGTLLSLENEEYELVELFDLRGGLVNVLPVVPTILWDGGDRSGRPSPPGIYILRFRGAGAQRQFKLFHH